MRIAIESPQLSATDFSEILDILKTLIVTFCYTYV